jgi:hypothetical protein
VPYPESTNVLSVVVPIKCSDNQRWMPRLVGSSLMDNDNLRLMQSVLGPTCLLMGNAKKAGTDGRDQGSNKTAE